MPAEIDYANAKSVSSQLSAALAARPAVLVVDLAGTTFCDSAGIALLAQAHRAAAAAGTQIRLVVPSGGLVIRVFSLAGVDQVWSLHASLDAALTAAPADGSRPQERPASGPGA